MRATICVAINPDRSPPPPGVHVDGSARVATLSGMKELADLFGVDDFTFSLCDEDSRSEDYYWSLASTFYDVDLDRLLSDQRSGDSDV